MAKISLSSSRINYSIRNSNNYKKDYNNSNNKNNYNTNNVVNLYCKSIVMSKFSNNNYNNNNTNNSNNNSITRMKNSYSKLSLQGRRCKRSLVVASSNGTIYLRAMIVFVQ